MFIHSGSHDQPPTSSSPFTDTAAPCENILFSLTSCLSKQKKYWCSLPLNNIPILYTGWHIRWKADSIYDVATGDKQMPTEFSVSATIVPEPKPSALWFAVRYPVASVNEYKSHRKRTSSKSSAQVISSSALPEKSGCTANNRSYQASCRRLHLHGRNLSDRVPNHRLRSV